MFKKYRSIILCAAVLGMILGCSGVEKRSKVYEGTALGAGLGGIIGAGAGHASALGGGPGALVGMSLGATTGMLTTGRYYQDPDTVGIDSEELRQALASRDLEVSELELQIEKSEAQKLALIEAHQAIQQEMEQLRSGMGSGTRLSADASGAYKVTILAELMFDSGSATLTSAGKSELARAARQIRTQFPDAYIEVRGHTDSVPITRSDWKSNWELSAARAVSVLHFLVDEHRFNEQRIKAVGFADTKPVASNDTEAGRRQNRRAEIVIIPAGSQAARELDLE